MAEAIKGDSKELDEEVAKEWEHTILQDSMGKELNELNRRLEQKESEMKMFTGFDTLALKQHFKKKLMELEEEKRAVQKERDRLLAEVENLAAASDGQVHKLPDNHLQKLKALEAQILDLKKKQENQVQLLKQKQRSEEAAKKLQEEIQFIKAQKVVQLQHKIKQEAEQFRQWKASREKELLQVLHRKTEEAAMATKKLKELLETQKSSALISNGHLPGGQLNEKSLHRWLDHELEVMVHVHEVRNEYEKQSQVRTALAEELAFLKREEASSNSSASPPRVKNGHSRVSSLSPNARLARITSLENMVSISSNTLVTMASQLSEAEERERAFAGHGRWSQLRSMGEAKNLLHYIFNVAADARCKLREKEIEIKELKDQLKELVSLLRLSEARRKEMEKQQNLGGQAVAVALPASPPVSSNGSLKHSADDTSAPLSPIAVPAQKQLKYTAGIVNSRVKGL
ncbi:unnamed protein product [Musa acuminata subsp. burmannicoides]